MYVFHFDLGGGKYSVTFQHFQTFPASNIWVFYITHRLSVCIPAARRDEIFFANKNQLTTKRVCILWLTWNPKQPFINGCLVISNHFLCKDWVSLIQLIANHLFSWLAARGSRQESILFSHPTPKFLMFQIWILGPYLVVFQAVLPNLRWTSRCFWGPVIPPPHGRERCQRKPT